MTTEIKALYEEAQKINSIDGVSNLEAVFTTTKASGSLSIQTRGPANTGIWVDWGDGDSEWIEHTGTGNTITTAHTYGAAAGVKIVTFSGVLDVITYFRCSDATFGGSISGFAVMESLTYLNARTSAVFGDVGSLSGLTGLTELYLYTTSVSGDIGGLGTLVSLTRLEAYSTSVSGDIGGLSPLTSLTYLNLNTTSISGDIGGIGVLTSLTTLQARVTSISGDISGIDTLTSLTSLSVRSTSVTGDIGDLKTLTSLATLYVYDNTLDYVTTTLPAWSNATLGVYDLAFTQAEVDAFLIDLDTAAGT
ncbi:MAG: leucine-rich repeat domain-containing protein, partial [Planctomycetes bacterium]|nr:leucine-rich repeat domain-containing protein [Planctomycetota bacterium]